MLTLEISSNVLEIPNDSLFNTQSKCDWLFNTRSRVLQADWSILENNDKVTLTCPISITSFWIMIMVWSCGYGFTEILYLGIFFLWEMNCLITGSCFCTTIPSQTQLNSTQSGVFMALNWACNRDSAFSKSKPLSQCW